MFTSLLVPAASASPNGDHYVHPEILKKQEEQKIKKVVEEAQIRYKQEDGEDALLVTDEVDLHPMEHHSRVIGSLLVARLENGNSFCGGTDRGKHRSHSLAKEPVRELRRRVASNKRYVQF